MKTYHVRVRAASPARLVGATTDIQAEDIADAVHKIAAGFPSKIWKTNANMGSASYATMGVTSRPIDFPIDWITLYIQEAH